jgi:hypothetical protein
MDLIGTQKIWTFSDGAEIPKPATNWNIRHEVGHPVQTYFDLAKKVAQLQFLNRDYVFLFRGQKIDYKTTRGNTTLKPGIFRSSDGKRLTRNVAASRFLALRDLEEKLVARYKEAGFQGIDRLKRQRILRWAILQHYEACETPLLDVTQSLRIAASFASIDNNTTEAFVFALGVPNLSGAITASSEAGLQIVRLSSACPPEAVRPHIQEGYLLGEYPDISDFDQKLPYSLYEMDFGRRLIGKSDLTLPPSGAAITILLLQETRSIRATIAINFSQ